MIELIKDNPYLLLGTTMLCPHCNQALKVTRVSSSVNATYDPSGMWNEYVLIMLEDGEWARFWFNEYPDLPRNYEE